MGDGRSGYSLLYRIHFRPWEFDRTPPELIEVAERLCPGRALELGCGTGRQAIELARRGWDVTAVDYVPAAIDQACSRAEEQGAMVRFLIGDVTRLDELPLGDPFDVVYDNKCFHGLPAAARPLYSAAIPKACRAGATFLLWALPGSSTRRRLGMPAGVDPADVERAFRDAFKVRRHQPARGGPFTPACYKMVRRKP